MNWITNIAVERKSGGELEPHPSLSYGRGYQFDRIRLGAPGGEDQVELWEADTHSDSGSQQCVRQLAEESGLQEKTVHN